MIVNASLKNIALSSLAKTDYESEKAVDNFVDAFAREVRALSIFRIPTSNINQGWRLQSMG